MLNAHIFIRWHVHAEPRNNVYGKDDLSFNTLETIWNEDT